MHFPTCSSDWDLELAFFYCLLILVLSFNIWLSVKWQIHKYRYQSALQAISQPFREIPTALILGYGGYSELIPMNAEQQNYVIWSYLFKPLLPIVSFEFQIQSSLCSFGSGLVNKEYQNSITHSSSTCFKWMICNSNLKSHQCEKFSTFMYTQEIGYVLLNEFWKCEFFVY